MLRGRGVLRACVVRFWREERELQSSGTGDNQDHRCQPCDNSVITARHSLGADKKRENERLLRLSLPRPGPRDRP